MVTVMQDKWPLPPELEPQGKWHPGLTITPCTRSHCHSQMRCKHSLSPQMPPHQPALLPITALALILYFLASSLSPISGDIRDII